MKTRNNTKEIAIAGVAAICVAFGAAAARADQASASLPERTVHFADLNLNTQAGASALYSRIRKAAEQVCGDVHSRRLEEAQAAKACIAQAIQASVGSVNNVRLNNEYNAHLVGAAKSISVASTH